MSRAQLTAFTRFVAERHGVDLEDYQALHRFSVDRRGDFWTAVWGFTGVVGDGPGPALGAEPDSMPGARWFPDARLNYAENLLRRADDSPALIFRGEDRVERSLTHAELRSRVASLAAALRSFDVGPGDRICAMLPNLPETMLAALAAASIGAVWSSCSPDFGVRGVLDRFAQVEPKVLLTTDGYFYAGKLHDVRERSAALREQLPSVERWIFVPYADADATTPRGAHRLDDLLDEHAGADLEFTRVPFDHPHAILFSSGTTGPPKCIVHGVGGTLLQHAKEHRLHVDLGPGDRFFYFTTCGWMMWNWLLSGLASEATLCLYDGSPTYPDVGALFRFAETERFDVFGTSAKFIDAVAKSGFEPGR